MSDHAYSDLDAFFREEAWLMRLAKRLVRDDAAAQDLVQETWAAALSTPIADKTQPRAWLGTVIRRLANKQREKLQPAVGHQLDEEHSQAASPVETVQKFVAGNLLRKALEALEEPYKTTLLLRYQSELGQRAIADQMGVSERTVRNRLTTGHDRLKASLGADFEPGASRQWALALSPLLPRDFFKSPKPVAATAGVKAAGTLAAAVLVGVSAIGALQYFTRDRVPTAPLITPVAGVAPGAETPGLSPTQDLGALGAGEHRSPSEEPTTSQVGGESDGTATTSPDPGPTLLVSQSRFRLDGKALTNGIAKAFNPEVPGVPEVPTDADGFAILHTVPGKVSVSFSRYLTDEQRREGKGYGKPAFSKELTIPKSGQFDPIDFNVATGRLQLVNAPKGFFQTPAADLGSEATTAQGFYYKSLTCEMGDEPAWTFNKVPATEVLISEVAPMVIVASPDFEDPELDETQVWRKTYTILADKTLTVDLTTGEQVYTDRVDDY